MFFALAEYDKKPKLGMIVSNPLPSSLLISDRGTSDEYQSQYHRRRIRGGVGHQVADRGSRLVEEGLDAGR